MCHQVCLKEIGNSQEDIGYSLHKIQGQKTRFCCLTYLSSFPRYLRLVLQYSDVIVGQFFGHQNTDTFRLFYNRNREYKSFIECFTKQIYTSEQPVSWAMIAPGLTPRILVDGMRKSVKSNPSIRLYKYSVYDGKVLDYSQFSLSLKKTALEMSPHWEVYNFSSQFDQKDGISASILDQVYCDMVEGSPDSSPSLQKYLASNTAKMVDPRTCSSWCKRVHLCAIPNVDIFNFNKCISTTSHSEPQTNNLVMLVSVVVILLSSTSDF